jgi:hypothetical protein
MTDQQQQPRDWRNAALIVLGVLVVGMAGVIIGYLASGGLDGTTAAVETTTTSSTVVQAPPATLPPVSQSTIPDDDAPVVPSDPAPTVPPDTSVPGQITFTAVADATTSTDDPTTNFGAVPLLGVENDPPELVLALVRFDVSGIPDGATIASAVFRIHVEATVEVPVSLHTVEGEWDELAVTANTAPLIGDTVAALPGGTPVQAYAEADLTSLVTGNGLVNLYLASSSDSPSEYTSREGAFPPTLTVSWNE